MRERTRAVRGFVLGAVALFGLVTASVADAAQVPSRADTTITFTVAGMSCSGCAKTAAELLRKVEGVLKADVNFKTKQATLRTNGAVTENQIRIALGAVGFEPRFRGETALPPLTPEERARLDIQTVSRGEAIVVRDHVASGKITMFDFFADWCGPCHLLTPKLERLVLNHDNLALRKVDISDWDTPAAKQATEEFKMPGLPYVRIYDDRGQLLGAVHGNHIDQVGRIVERGRRP